MDPASSSLPSSDSRLESKNLKRQRPDAEEDANADNSSVSRRMSNFPLVVRHTINCPHHSVLATVSLENLSHGQLEALSSSPNPPALVFSPPPITEGRGVTKRLGDAGRVFVVPAHSDWFSPDAVHRLERQVVPHFTPERYIALRNKIVSLSAGNPGRRLLISDFQGIVSGRELYDLSRIVRFLDHWGIINYMAGFSMSHAVRMFPSLLREEGNGEVRLGTSALTSIDRLILFDRPKCSLRVEDIASLASASTASDVGLEDLDRRIRERLSGHACSYCSCPLLHVHYQSQKKADVILCPDCFHDAKFVAGHSSVDFARVDSEKDTLDLDGLNWTDEETLLLLEAVEKYNDNWNQIAKHVVTKSTAQCILHFLRLPMEVGWLENIEVAPMVVSSSSAQEHDHGHTCSDSEANLAGVFPQLFDSGMQLPFADSVNPVMSLVAFLASAIGPRIAAACASASLSVLTKGDTRLNYESAHAGDGSRGADAKSSHQMDECLEDQVPYIRKETVSPPADHVKFAARKLEKKLIQFVELESSLTKECEQVENARQRISAERVRMMSVPFEPAIHLNPNVNASNLDHHPWLRPTSGNANCSTSTD